MAREPVIDDLSDRLESNRERITEWMSEKRASLPTPIYASVDIRDAGWKVAAVDANAFPAGFNNVSKDDRNRMSIALGRWFDSNYDGVTSVHLWPESHTRNKGYVENLRALKAIVEGSGRSFTVGSPNLNGLSFVEGLNGSLELSNVSMNDGVTVGGEKPDLVLLNNDLTDAPIPELVSQRHVPNQEMGWHRRRKSNHFTHAQPFIDEVAEILDLDPWLLGTHWFVSPEKCLEKEVCITELAAQVDDCIQFVQSKYDSFEIEAKPRLFLKNDSGTYGLGIIEIDEGEQLFNLSKRKINKLTYGKGGQHAEDFLIQEGVPTNLQVGEGLVEPCFYGIGGDAAATFYRYNTKKGNLDNLNTPSTQFLGREEIFEMGGQEIVSRIGSWQTLVAEIAMLGMASEIQSTL